LQIQFKSKVFST